MRTQDLRPELKIVSTFRIVEMENGDFVLQECVSYPGFPKISTTEERGRGTLEEIRKLRTKLDPIYVPGYHIVKRIVED